MLMSYCEKTINILDDVVPEESYIDNARYDEPDTSESKSDLSDEEAQHEDQPPAPEVQQDIAHSEETKPFYSRFCFKFDIVLFASILFALSRTGLENDPIDPVPFFQ